MKKCGKVYVASMNMRGTWANAIDNDSINSIKINVTSAQAKNNKNRISFSPMTEIIGTYKGYWNFESYWQSGKVYEDIPHVETKKWWKSLKEPKRRYPNSKGKKVLYAVFDGNDENMDYVTSRKKVYVPEYYDLIKNKKMTQYWKKMVTDGNNLIIYDFDGPRKENGDVDCCEVTLKLLLDKINHIKHPFGHGYVVAATFLDISPEKYCK